MSSNLLVEHKLTEAEVTRAHKSLSDALTAIHETWNPRTTIEAENKRDLIIKKYGFVKIGTQYLLPQEYQNLLLERAKELEPDFVLDEIFKEMMFKMALYHTNDPRFEELGFGKLNKGLYIVGNVGTGKTLLSKIFLIRPNKNNTNSHTNAPKCINTNKVCNDYQAHGIERVMSNYGTIRFSGDYETKKSPFDCDITFDDLGSENTSCKYMGNEANPMEQIILDRYEDKTWHRYTHFTSNLDADAIKLKYGLRVKSRLNEMLNFLVLEGTDRRK